MHLYSYIRFFFEPHIIEQISSRNLTTGNKDTVRRDFLKRMVKPNGTPYSATEQLIEV